jgi:hypothetical protein
MRLRAAEFAIVGTAKRNLHGCEPELFRHRNGFGLSGEPEDGIHGSNTESGGTLREGGGG